MVKKQQRQKRRVFTPEFRAEAVRLCKVGDRTISQVAKDLDLTENPSRLDSQDATAEIRSTEPSRLDSQMVLDPEHAWRRSGRPDCRIAFSPGMHCARQADAPIVDSWPAASAPARAVRRDDPPCKHEEAPHRAAAHALRRLLRRASRSCAAQHRRPAPSSAADCRRTLSCAKGVGVHVASLTRDARIGISNE